MTVHEADHDDGLKLLDLRCFDAVVREGSFQRAARALNRSHPSVFAAVRRLEARVGLTLLDRTGYRAVPTEKGWSFHRQAAIILADAARLSAHARVLATGAEPVIRVVLGDLCPRPLVLKLLSAFFADLPGTRLHLDHEAVGGPAERLREGTADIVFHRVERADLTIERIDLQEVRLLPVAAPGFLPDELVTRAEPQHLRAFTQCVIRDTARGGGREDHFLVEGAHRCTVPDHAMKRDLILHRMAWGHLPDFLIADDLAAGRLIRVGGPALPGATEVVAAIRRVDRASGPVAERLWRHIAERLNDDAEPHRSSSSV